jgi:hypothetical protein
MHEFRLSSKNKPEVAKAMTTAWHSLRAAKAGLKKLGRRHGRRCDCSPCSLARSIRRTLKDYLGDIESVVILAPDDMPPPSVAGE